MKFQKLISYIDDYNKLDIPEDIKVAMSDGSYPQTKNGTLIFKKKDDDNNYRHSELIHRKNGPAVIDENGKESWYINNQLHREDGPAITDKQGNEAWFFNGKLHREDGPALKIAGKLIAYYIHGELHNEQKPALKTNLGEEYYENGEVSY